MNSCREAQGKRCTERSQEMRDRTDLRDALRKSQYLRVKDTCLLLLHLTQGRGRILSYRAPNHQQPRQTTLTPERYTHSHGNRAQLRARRIQYPPLVLLKEIFLM